MSWGTLPDWVITMLLATGVFILTWAKKGVETAVSVTTKNAIDKVNWPNILARELEKTRGAERQELRFSSYGLLWSRMRPMAIYDRDPFDRDAMKNLSNSLSNWYFSENGGLMLTVPVRELYFTLQDLLREIGFKEYDWSGRRTGESKAIFAKFLRCTRRASASALIAYFENISPEKWIAEDLVARIRSWRKDIETIPEAWQDLDPELKFAVVQQVSSALRTGLSADVESRLR